MEKIKSKKTDYFLKEAPNFWAELVGMFGSDNLFHGKRTYERGAKIIPIFVEGNPIGQIVDYRTPVRRKDGTVMFIGRIPGYLGNREIMMEFGTGISIHFKKGEESWTKMETFVREDKNPIRRDSHKIHFP